VANAHGSAPDTVYTDSLRAYSSGVNVFQNAKRVENCGIAKRQTNNRIERMNGTLRERVKVQRGWKTKETQLAEGNRIQYNFVKPHIALEGKTPAQEAGINLGNKDKWLEFLQNSVRE